MRGRTAHRRSGQQRLSRRGGVRRRRRRSGLVGADGGDRVVRPRGVQSRAGGDGGFGLHRTVSRRVSHAVADSWQLL